MCIDKEKIIFHVDVNSAYLSWTAVKQLQYGGNTDIREIPSVIAGDIANRHGIILAASIPAKELGIKTGEPLFSAKQKCRNLEVYPPDYEWYIKSSNALVKILKSYSSKVQRYSIDECFLECSDFKDNYIEKAYELKNRIRNELGFNCNIGISTNKLLAKMAGDFKPKNSIHTLFKNEIKEKMWPLPVGDLFMVGKATKKKLDKLNIETIGEIANADVNFLKSVLNSHGKLIHEYANGIDNSRVEESEYLDIKGIGNSTTVAFDIDNREDALKILLSLTESVCMRLRENGSRAGLVAVSIKCNNFFYYSHQKALNNKTDSTSMIFEGVKRAFDECWKGERIRQLGVRVSKLSRDDYFQESFFDYEKNEKQMKIDKTIDALRKKFGNDSIMRSSFLNSGIKHIEGGTGSIGDYPMMNSFL